MRKSISELSLNITEEEYRADPALSYSTLAKFERGGFNELEHLFDKVESPSLTFGSAVDSLLTGGEKEFNDRFIVAEFPAIADSIVNIIKALHRIHSDNYRSLTLIPDSVMLAIIDEHKYQPNWKPETRCKVIKEKGEEYYTLLTLAEDKTILDTQTYQDVLNAVDALKTSESTKDYFFDNNPFNPDVEGFYQLKFKATLNGIDYRCMFDRINVYHNLKVIQPIDLKTSYKKEWDFYKSFIEWNYQIQNRLYYRILKEVLSKDPYYKDFKILPYKDIVVNRYSLTPLVWDCDFTFTVGTLRFGENNQIIMRDPEEIGRELSQYLSTPHRVPMGINYVGGNDLRTWINKII